MRQGWPFDGLHVAPEMSVVIPQIAEPAPAWMPFELERHVVDGGQLTNQPLERGGERRLDFDLLLDLENVLLSVHCFPFLAGVSCRRQHWRRGPRPGKLR